MARKVQQHGPVPNPSMVVSVRFEADEFDVIAREAEAQHLKVSTYIRLKTLGKLQSVDSYVNRLSLSPLAQTTTWPQIVLLNEKQG